MRIDPTPLIDTWVIKHHARSMYWLSRQRKWVRDVAFATMYHSIPSGEKVLKEDEYLLSMKAYLMPIVIIPYEKHRRNMKAKNLRLVERQSHGKRKEFKKEPMRAVSFIASKNLYAMFKAYCARRDISPSKAFRRIMRLCVKYDGREIPMEKIMI